MFRAEIIRVAWDALRANKVKAFLTMLGVVIGSACIVLVVTVALSGKQYILAQIEGIGANIVYAEFIRSGPREVVLADEISLADMEAVRVGISQVVRVAGTRELPQRRIRNLIILRGRFLDADDIAARSKVCVITQELSDLLFPADEPVGKSVRMGELSFTVVGVFRERVATFGQSEIKRESLVIPFSLMRYYTDEYVRVLYAQADSPHNVASVTLQVGQILRSRHRVDAVYLVENLTSLLDAAKKISTALTVILLIIAFIALVISGIGIMNIMLVTVTERTREIGIRKAIGARKQEILSQFLLEAFLISGSGGIVGIFIAVLIPVLIQPLLPGNLTVPISGWSIVVAFFVSCFTGVLFGYLPANRAARLQPTESLRYE
jgi:putative ABC transport system permease protein